MPENSQPPSPNARRYPGGIGHCLSRDSRGRFMGIDILRGSAIVTMLAANAAAPCLAPPHPFVFRTFGSFAAPLFVFLAGFMVPAGKSQQIVAGSTFKACRLLTVALLVDVVIWNIVPFTTFDVLYLIASALPLTALSLSHPVMFRIGLCLACFLAGPLLAMALPYHPHLHEFSLFTVWNHRPSFDAARMTQSILFDGWFPLTPWLGFALGGSLAYSHGGIILRHARASALAGLFLFGTGLLWLHLSPPLQERDGYSELFYPPGIAYVVTAIGFLLITVASLPRLRTRWWLQPLALLGRHSLWIYVFQLAAIRFLLAPCFPMLSMGAFVALYVALSFATWAFALLIAQVAVFRGNARAT